MSVSRLFALSQEDLLPSAHYDYLVSLKASGFEPNVIYDIGACVLHWTHRVKALWPDATYVLFDALEEVAFLYEGHLHHIGVLCDRDDRDLTFYTNLVWPGGCSYYREIGCPEDYFPPTSGVPRRGMSLDTIVQRRGFPLPDLVKIDVQGAEKDIITGGRQTLAHAQHLLCEMQHTEYNDGAPHVDTTLPFIEAQGWTCVAPRFSHNGPDADYGFTRVAVNTAPTPSTPPSPPPTPCAPASRPSNARPRAPSP